MPHALQFLVLTLGGWLNRHQEVLIDYLREENRVLSFAKTLSIESRTKWTVSTTGKLSPGMCRLR